MNRLKRLWNMFDNVGRNFALQAGVYGAYFRGQLGNAVVGGTWKNKKTLRTYAIPTNPKTVGQVLQRSKFKISQVVASFILAIIVKIYWNPFADGQSGFNAFIGLNSQRVSGNTDFLGIEIVNGSYEPIAAITAATYNTANGDVNVTWTTTVQTIGDTLDELMILALDITDYDPAVKTPILLFDYKEDKTRGEGNEDLSLRSGLTPADIFVYIGVRQPATDPILKIGTSKSRVCVAL